MTRDAPSRASRRIGARSTHDLCTAPERDRERAHRIECGGLRILERTGGERASALRVAPRRHGALRLFATRALERAAALAGGRAWHRRSLGRALSVREECVEIDGLPAAFDGFAIAHLSDLHGGPFLGPGDLCAVIERVAALRADACVVTGDWITHACEEAFPLLDDLAQLSFPHGAWAVFGNHDYHARQEARIVDHARSRGVRVLRNERVAIERAGARVELTGLEDLEEARELRLPERAASQVRAIEPEHAPSRTRAIEIVLCHNPLAARSLAAQGAALVLSGHSHGAQLDLPFLRRLGPVHPGLRVELGGATLIVSRGIGVVGAPLRIGSPPEIVLVRLARRQRAERAA